MSAAKVVVDGWRLQQRGHGMASFVGTLLKGLAESTWRNRTRVAIPRESEAAVPAGLTALPLRGGTIRTGVLGEALWQDRLGRHMRGHAADDILLAPAPFVSSARVPRAIVVCHDVIPIKFPRYLGRFLHRRWMFNAQLRWMRDVSRVITDSRHTAAELGAVLGPRLPPTVTIPLWTSLADSKLPTFEAREAVRNKYRLPSRYWLYVGGYDYRKNVELLIEAYGQVARSVSCPTLVLAGTIPIDTRLPVCDVAGALSRAGLAGDHLCLPGYIEQDDLGSVYAGAELFVYPSLAEGFGLPPVEAMSCGCPAIVADTSSLPEVVTDDDYRFPVARPARLIEMLRSAAHAPMPLNPGFDRAFYGRARGLDEYLRVIEQVMAES